jgi:hypothetical protein
MRIASAVGADAEDPEVNVIPKEAGLAAAGAAPHTDGIIKMAPSSKPTAAHDFLMGSISGMPSNPTPSR